MRNGLVASALLSPTPIQAWPLSGDITAQVSLKGEGLGRMGRVVVSGVGFCPVGVIGVDISKGGNNSGPNNYTSLR